MLVLEQLIVDTHSDFSPWAEVNAGFLDDRSFAIELVFEGTHPDYRLLAIVSPEDAQRMATQLDAPLFRVSVHEGLNIKALFTYLAVTLQKKFLSSLNSLPLGSDAFFVGTPEERAEERSTSETARSKATPQNQQQGGRCSVA